ncbi:MULTISPECIES: DUF6177 family protein [Kocuria]|uniref:Uncharacterized protein n=1 Tax=Kocuria subflava TaxID=1736139 RepID=A0A846TUN1_9MICC|nr:MULTISPECIES: DUF6177 family protein [Kocuria]NKE10549.1 hypothetical protein [Kocuria subflava]
MSVLGCDVTTSAAGVMLNDAAIVHHNTWIARAMDQCATSGLRFVLVTPPTTRLTLGLSRLLELTGGLWVVSGADGLPYNGLNGAMLQWDGEDYKEAQEISVAFQEGIRPSAGGVVISAETLYPARRSTVVGTLTETAARVLTGEAPQAWGVQEPVSQPWSPQAITERYRNDPSPINVMHAASTVGSDHLVAVTQIERPKRGVVERVTAGFRTAEPWGGEERVRFAHLMHQHGVRWAVGQHVLGFDPAYRVPHYAGIPVPSVAVFGPEALSSRGEGEALNFARGLAGAEADDCVELIGNPGKASLAIQFQNQPSSAREHPVLEYNRITDFLAHSQTRRDSPD